MNDTPKVQTGPEKNHHSSYAAIVSFEYSDGKGEDMTVRFCVPENLLWEADGLKYLFESSRESYVCPPGSNGFDEDQWESWHLVSVEDAKCFVIDGIVNCPPFPSLAPPPAEVTGE